ncbi:MAG: porin family protein [Rhizobiaceae bacterium]|nr:porin family protein [Rhizobiaceae bacterium]
MSTTMKFARPAATAIALIAMASFAPAYAADAVMEEPPAPAAPMEQPPLNTWSGPYAGISLGYGFAGHTNEPGNDIGTDGFIGDGFAGYNYQADRFVMGVEGDLGYSGVEGSNAGTSSKGGGEGSLRARLGYAVTPDILLYATGGGAGRSIKLEEGGVSDRNTLFGWTAGAGADVKITERVFGRVEYRYTDFGSENFNTGSGSRSVDANDQRITFGIGMQF